MVKQALIILAVVIVFGILVPLYKGFALLDPRIIAAYAFLALLFVAPASAELSGARILGKIAIIVAWGWGVTALILATAFVTLNVVNRPGGFLVPPPEFLASVLTFSLCASIAIAMLGAVLARRFSALAVKNMLRTGFLVILLGLAFGSRLLPESVTLAIFDRFSTRRALTRLAWESAAVGALIALILLFPLLKNGNGPSFAKIPMAENPEDGGR